MVYGGLRNGFERGRRGIEQGLTVIAGMTQGRLEVVGAIDGVRRPGEEDGILCWRKVCFFTVTIREKSWFDRSGLSL